MTVWTRSIDINKSSRINKIYLALNVSFWKTVLGVDSRDSLTTSIFSSLWRETVNSQRTYPFVRTTAAGIALMCGATLAFGQSASGLPKCESLVSLSPLANNPAVYSATAATTTTAAPNSVAYCMVNVVWRDPREVGATAGYAAGKPPTVDTFQTIRLGIALPLNTQTGNAAWGGRLIMTAGGGDQGSVPDLSDMINMTPPEIGGGSDSGHGDANSGAGDSYGIIQGQRLNYGKIKDWAGGRANGVTVKLAKQLADVYYGRAPKRTYWNACSGGGHMGWAQVENYPGEYDGALIGAPAHNWQEFRLADGWDAIVRRKVAQQTTAITQAQMDAANAAANTACAAKDGVTVNGVAIMNDPRACTWSATNNICGAKGAPAAPDCLNKIQAAGIDLAWAGPHNGFGKRIWGPYDRGINHGVATASTMSTPQVLHYNHFDENFDISNLYLDQQSINLAAAGGADVRKAIVYENEAVLGSVRTADYIDDNDPSRLETARRNGMKIMVYHGLQDPAIQFRNDIDFYIRVASYFANGGGNGYGAPGLNSAGGNTPDFDKLKSWYRLFLVPNAGHCPTVPEAMPALINWVENDVPPDSLVEPAVSGASSTGGAAGGNGSFGSGGTSIFGGGPTTTIPLLCPFPQKAIYQGGATDDASSYRCGGNLQTAAVICDGLRTVYKRENGDQVQSYGSYNPSICGKSGN
ncbi:tannase/feruloyl esterase family alpha/beta hydrolase [Paraburkholderia sp.]|uniref:tannase/feruloyl esterase family alpha/beta hydrolase n=1 Tax=Paraburkholderia sp. TaxID=1926495 RepID=UPI003D6F9380